MSHVRRILKAALPGKNSNVARRIRRAERIEAAIYRRYQATPWRWQAKHIRWFFEVHAQAWKPTSRYDAWREVRAVLEAVGKPHVVALLINGPKADYLRPTGIAGRLSAVGRPPKLSQRKRSMTPHSSVMATPNRQIRG